MPLLTVAELTLRYRGMATPAVDAASFSVNKGEIFGLLGPSGSGKTSVLRAIGGFERPDGGRVTLGGKTIAAPDCFVQPEKRHVGFVFQEFALFPHLTVLENVMFGLRGGSRADRQLAKLPLHPASRGCGMSPKRSARTQRRIARY